MLKQLENIDPALLRIHSGNGNILISNALQGRVMAEINGELIHRFDAALAKNPDPENFNNLGGNSLWPAPEGGDFAFNYPPQGAWYVQKGINSVPAALRESGDGFVVIGKGVELLNRKNRTVKLDWNRRIERCADLELPIACLSYRTVDTLTLGEPGDPAEILVAAWSLEQLPGAAGVTAFGRCAKGATGAINADFYGNPHPRLSYAGEWFRFALGGANRLQIGVNSAFAPELIGSFDPARGVAVLRSTPPRTDGRYINIADNDQTAGAYSSADAYSIFNGAEELNFHELETIAPMTLDGAGRVTGSTLESTTIILSGRAGEVRQLLSDVYGVPGEFLN